MRILVTNNTFSFTGGSETYAYAVIRELVSRGHDVDAFTTGPCTMIAGEIAKLGVKIYFKVVPDKEYDLIIGSHTSTFKHLEHFKCKKIQTCHGIYPDLEQPYPGVQHVAISKEVQHHLTYKGYESTLIHNGVNCDRFAPRVPIRKDLTKVLSLSHDQGVNSMLDEACKKLGVDFEWHNKYINPMFNIEDKIQEADLVVTLGRGAYESMAAGRNVLIFDKRGYSGLPAIGDGLLTMSNIEKSLEHNCSGRATKKEFTVDDIVNELRKYHKDNGKMMREYALKNFNIEHQIDKYLSI